MSLNEVWEGASSSPFYPSVPKSAEFFLGFTLLSTGKQSQLSIHCSGIHADLIVAIVLTGLFGLSMFLIGFRNPRNTNQTRPFSQDAASVGSSRFPGIWVRGSEHLQQNISNQL